MVGWCSNIGRVLYDPEPLTERLVDVDHHNSVQNSDTLREKYGWEHSKQVKNAVYPYKLFQGILAYVYI